MGGLERGGQELRIDRAKPRARLRPERQSGDGAEVHDTPIYFSERSRLRTDSAWPSRTRSFGVRPPKLEFGVLSHSSGLAKNLPASARRSESSSGRSALPAGAMTRPVTMTQDSAMGRPTPGRDFGRARAADAARRVLVNRAPHGSRPASRLRPLALSPLRRGVTGSDAIGRPLAGCGTTRPEPEVNVTRGSREVVWCNHKRGAIIRCSTPAEHRRASLLISMPGSCSSGGMICPMYFPDRKRGRGGSCSALLVRGGKNKFQSL